MLDNLSGQIIKSYDMLELIGTGGFGAVYRARQRNVEREVAIKIILPQHANHPEFIRRFETEAQLVARLEHPHIVPLYDYWREPDSAYLVMRYLRGGSLRDLLEAKGPWDLRAVALMVMQIGSALSFAHSNGVIHRDLKSDNIMIDETGNSYLGDFGIAKDLGSNASMTKDALLGTPAYLAPEQIRGEIASAQSDLYALGIMVFEALTGSKPFYDLTPATVLYKQLNEPLPDIHKARPDLPEAVNLVLQRATAKNINDRYQDAMQFARDFQRAALATEAETTEALEIKGGLSITRLENELAEINNPYKGLRAFQQADAGDFFGRKELVEQLVNRLRMDDRQDPNQTIAQGAHFLAVVGPSGSGKSSVVRAGLIPSLQRGALPGSEDWYFVDMMPGTHPLEELEAALLGVAPAPIPGLLRQLEEDERGLLRAVKRVLPTNEGRLVLVIDQFEEVFTLVEREERRAHFLNSLLAAANDARSRMTIIITMRADFYDRPLLYSDFGELIKQRTELVLPLTVRGLREAITGPAERVGVSVEPALVNAIVNDVNHQPGALPLLQYALTELFERREGRKLMLQTYQDIGGTSGALAQRAEEIFNQLSDTAQQAARQMFLRLVSLGEGTEDTRRRVYRSELLSLGASRHVMQDVIDTFGKYRLLTFDHEPMTRSSTVEVAHEALIRQWERLRAWLDETREELRLQRRLTAAAEEWVHAGRDAGFLARGGRLQQFEEWSQTSDLALTEDEADFLQASIQNHQEQLAAERARQEREEALEERSRRFLRALVAVLSVAAIVGLGLAAFAFNQSQIAQEQQRRAEDAFANVARQELETRSLALAANARNALIEDDPQLALALALEAAAISNENPNEIKRVLASTAYAPAPRYRFEAHTGSVLDVTFSGDGTLAGSASADGTLRLWDVSTGEAVLRLDAPTAEQIFSAVALNEDGSLLAAGLNDGLVLLWDVKADEEITRLRTEDDEFVKSLAFSPDGSLLAAAGHNQLIELFDVDTGELVRTLRGHVGGIFMIAFSPDGSLLASSSGDENLTDDSFDDEERVVRLWDVSSGDNIRVIDPEAGFVRAVDIGPNGDLVALGTWDSANGGTVRVYDIDTGEELRRFFAHADVVTDVDFSPEGDLIASASWEQSVRLWDLERGVEVQTFEGFRDRVLAVDYHPSGEFLLIGHGNIGNNEYTPESDNPVDTSVWLWDLVNRAEIRALDDHEDWVWTVAISPDGQHALSGGGPLNLPSAELGGTLPQIDTAVRLWNIETGEVINRYTGHSNTVDSVLFHPDGETFFSAAWDGLVIRWDLETGERLRLYRGATSEIYDLALSADGSLLVSAANDSLVRLYDVASGELLREFVGHEAGVNGVSFSPDETQLASASWDGTVRLWDVSTGEESAIFEGHTSGVNEVIFTPDGRQLISSSWDDTVRLWDIASGQQVRAFTGHNGNTFGLAITSDGQTLLTTSQDTTVRMWDMTTGEELQRFDQPGDWVQEIELSPGEDFAISADQNRLLYVYRINRTVDELVRYARENRYVRELTPAERERYRLTDER